MLSFNLRLLYERISAFKRQVAVVANFVKNDFLQTIQGNVQQFTDFAGRSMSIFEN
jgi:hypothetical protein